MADETTEPTPFNAAELTNDDLTAEYNRIRTRGGELSAQENLSDTETTELGELASRLTSVTSELDARETRANELSSQREAFSALPDRSVPVSAPVAPPAAPATVVEPTSVQKAAEPVAVPSVANLSLTPPEAPAAPAGRITAFVSSDAAGFVGKGVGQAYDGLTEISQALIASAQQYGRGSGAGKGSRHAIAQFRRQRDDALVISRPEDTAGALAHARDERRLHGGSLAKAWQHSIDTGASSLTAAAGWCAPSENDYDLCRQWSAGVGILDLPSVTVTRGGVNYTDEVNFAAIYANAVAVGGGSNFLTEAQVISDTLKTCSEIPCPEFEDRRLDVLALCIRVSFLQAAGYPEVVNAWTDGLLASNEQEMNRLIIADILARAGAATVVAAPGAASVDSFTSALLAGVELAAEDIRYQFMMPWNATVEIVLPHWVLPQIRADLSRRNGVSMLAVTDAEIATMFSVRNVRVQFVRGWQDGLITGGALNAAFPGGDAATPFLTELPSTVSFLAYPAGSVVVGRQDVVTLTNVYDSANLATNEFTSLFAEEGFAPLYPCQGQRLYTVTGCIGGVTGAANVSCADV
jgi:hypothetical protein